MSKFNEKQLLTLAKLNLPVYTFEGKHCVELRQLGVRLGYSDSGQRLVRCLLNNQKFAGDVTPITEGNFKKLRLNNRQASPALPEKMVVIFEGGIEKLVASAVSARVEAIRDAFSKPSTALVPVLTTKKSVKKNLIKEEPFVAKNEINISNVDISTWAPQLQAAYLLEVQKIEAEKRSLAANALEDLVGFLQKGDEFTRGELYGLLRLRAEYTSGINLHHITPAHLLDRGWKTPTQIAKDICYAFGIPVNGSSVKSVLHYLDFKPLQGTADSYRYITRTDNKEKLVAVQAYYYSPDAAKRVTDTFEKLGYVQKVKDNIEKREGKEKSSKVKTYTDAGDLSKQINMPLVEGVEIPVAEA